MSSMKYIIGIQLFAVLIFLKFIFLLRNQQLHFKPFEVKWGLTWHDSSMVS